MQTSYFVRLSSIPTALFLPCSYFNRIITMKENNQRVQDRVNEEMISFLFNFKSSSCDELLLKQADIFHQYCQSITWPLNSQVFKFDILY